MRARKSVFEGKTKGVAVESEEMPESIEWALMANADATHTPLSGAFELLPLCNLSCKMCYVRLTREEMDSQGSLLSCDEWLRIAKEACEKGLLFLLLTGGEPLLYPDFKRLYTEVSQMGVVVEVNTNGTLIDEEWADFFCEKGVRRLNITLYGADEATYETLCGKPDGFARVMRAAALLKERGVSFRFNCSLTPDNIDQLPEFLKIAKSFDVPLSPDVYMIPGARRGITAQEQFRLAAEEAALVKMHGDGLTSAEGAKATLAKLEKPPRLKDLEEFSCHAGRSAFFVNWRGEFAPCPVFAEPKVSLLECSFEEGWKRMVDACQKLPQCQECAECDLQNICSVCPAYCYAETGRTDGRPEYICRMTRRKVEELRRIAAAG